MKILQLLKNPLYLIIVVAISTILFAINYYLMANMLGNTDNACVIGGALTKSNIAFSGISSILTGLLMLGIFELIKKTQKRKLVAVGPVAGGGFAMGSFTVFCTSCTLPAISILGASIGLEFLNDYNYAMKIVSILILSLGLFLVNRQLGDRCEMCNINSSPCHI